MNSAPAVFSMELLKVFDLRYTEGPFGGGQWAEYSGKRWVALSETDMLLLIRKFLKNRHCTSIYDLARAVLWHARNELIQSQPARRRAGTEEKTA